MKSSLVAILLSLARTAPTEAADFPVDIRSNLFFDETDIDFEEYLRYFQPVEEPAYKRPSAEIGYRRPSTH